MSFDVVLIAVIVCRLALSGVYVRAEYLRCREHGAAQRRRDASLRARNAASLSDQRDALLPSVLKLQGFGEIDAANPDSAGEFASPRRASGLSNSPRTHFLPERRKRVRQRAL